MKDPLDGAQSMEKHKAKSKKVDLKKKKKAKAMSLSTASVSNTASLVLHTTDVQTARTRASKSLAAMTKKQQRVAINKMTRRLILEEISYGSALRELRVNVLGLKQEAYTELTGVSRKTLSEIENDKGNYTPEIINKVFKPFELKMGLVPISSSTFKTLLG